MFMNSPELLFIAVGTALPARRARAHDPAWLFQNCPGWIIKYGKYLLLQHPPSTPLIGVGGNIVSNQYTQVILGAARPEASEASMISAPLLVPPHLRPGQRRGIISAIARVVSGDHGFCRMMVVPDDH
jgi:hypothetical protein